MASTSVEMPEEKNDKKVPRPPIVYGERGIELKSFDDLWRFAVAAFRSGIVPEDCKTPEDAFIRIQTGAELGLPPMASVTSIAVINRRPCVWGDGAAALVQSHPDCEGFDEVEFGEENSPEWGYRCTIRRRGRLPVAREFTWQEAIDSGLSVKKGPWQQYRKRMLQMRARSWAMRDAFPDVFRGIKTVEEVYGIDLDGKKAPKEIALGDYPVETESVAPEEVVGVSETSEAPRQEDLGGLDLDLDLNLDTDHG